jgi:nucleoid DNA-binding protein
MTKAELVVKVTVAAGGKLTRVGSAEFVDGVFHELRQALIEGGRASYRHFGRWTVRRRGARRGFDPRTRQPLQLDAARTIAFQPAPRVHLRLGSRKV